jgi:phosphinothricin acetyltransferase
MSTLPRDHAARIRSAVPGDVAGMLAIYRPIVESSPISFEEVPPDEETFGRRVEEVQTFGPWLVCEEGGIVLGYAYAGPFRARPAYRWSCEATVYVHADHRRRGIARALYTALLGLVRLQGFRSVIAGITLPNDASVGVHEGLEFEPVGVFRRVGNKHGGWHDVGFWQLFLDELGERPPSPRAPTEVLASARGREILQESAACVQRAS